MIGKVMVRNSFRNVIKYVLDKEKYAQIISSEGILINSLDSIVVSFDMQASLRPSLKNNVGHIALSFSPNDKARCTDEFMKNVAKRYMNDMGIKDTQFVIVRHFDHKHPHIHIVYNRVDNKGKTITDRNQRLKNVRVCKELTRYYGLYVSTGKNNVNRDRLKEPDKSKYDIYDAIKEVLPNCYSWKQFCDALSEKEISVEQIFNGDTTDIQGVVFSLNGYHFNGSKVDKKYSYSKLRQQILKNNERLLNSNDNKKRRVAGQQRVNSISRVPTHADFASTNISAGSILSPTSASSSRNAEYEVGNSESEDNEEYRRRKGGYSL